MAKPPKINVTKTYTLFSRSDENRPLDLKRHRALEQQMQLYGYIPAYPIVCIRDEKGHLVVKDGQHRLAFAEKLGLPVYWVEDETGFDVASINNTQKAWLPIDYARKFADAGQADYAELLEFKEEHGIPLTVACSLLSGTVGFNAVSESFYGGTFVIKDRPWAKAVVSVYSPIVKMEPKLKAAPFLLACMAVSRVKGFSPKRVVENVNRCRQKLIAYANRDGYLDMLEEIYNFGQKNLIGLKIEATKAMRERNPRLKKNDAAQAEKAVA